MKKLIIFTTSLSFCLRKTLVDLHRQQPEVECLILELHTTKNWQKTWQHIKKQTKFHGVSWILQQGKCYLTKLLQAIKPKTSNKTQLFSYHWSEINKQSYIRHQICKSFTDQQIINQIKLFSPDLGLALFTPVLDKQLFNLPKLGTINVLQGSKRIYADVPAGYWELVNNKTQVLCTVQQLDDSLCAGDIILQSSISIPKYCTLKSLQLLLDEISSKLLIDAIVLISTGKEVRLAQLEPALNYPRPTIKQITQLKRSLLDQSRQTPIKQVIKQSIFYCYVNLLRPIQVWLQSQDKNPRVIVLLYHRVNDDLRDTLTVGVEQFAQQMKELSRYYKLVRLEDIAENKLPKHSHKPLIAVTFDDGYLDNYQYAMPILLRYQVPATFFISTGIVGTDKPFQHDLDDMGSKLPTMSWQQVNEMSGYGFSFGAHTVNHINCARQPKNVVEREIIASKQTITEKIGIEKMLFSYPFGKVTDITPEMLKYVKELGFIGCVSAYGGYNNNKMNPFNILRVGVDANFSFWAFKASLEGFYPARLDEVTP